MNQQFRKDIAEVIFNHCDLGGQTRKSAEQDITDRTRNSGSKEFDSLTKYIISAVNDAEDTDDAISNFEYAISELNKVRRNLEKLKIGLVD